MLQYRKKMMWSVRSKKEVNDANFSSHNFYFHRAIRYITFIPFGDFEEKSWFMLTADNCKDESVGFDDERRLFWSLLIYGRMPKCLANPVSRDCDLILVIIYLCRTAPHDRRDEQKKMKVLQNCRDVEEIGASWVKYTRFRKDIYLKSSMSLDVSECNQSALLLRYCSTF